MIVLINVCLCIVGIFYIRSCTVANVDMSRTEHSHAFTSQNVPVRWVIMADPYHFGVWVVSNLTNFLPYHLLFKLDPSPGYSKTNLMDAGLVFDEPSMSIQIKHWKTFRTLDISKNWMWLVGWVVIKAPRIFLNFVTTPYCQWRAANLCICSALMAIEQGGMFIVPQPAVIRDLGFCSFVRRTTPFYRFVRL